MRQATSLADKLRNVSPPVQTITPVSVYQETRNADIVAALTQRGFDQLMKPTEAELTYVNSVFQSKNFHDMDKVTFDAVSQIGMKEFQELNQKLQQFTKALGNVDTAGIFDMIDDLSKEVQESDLEGIYQKAVNAKIPLWIRFLALFNPQAVKKNSSNNLKKLQTLLKSRGGTLEVKLGGIEQQLRGHKDKQIANIKTLEQTFAVYYDSFKQLSKQFALIVYLEHSFSAQLEAYKQRHSGMEQNLDVNKKLQDYDRVLSDIQNKRLILHKSLLQLPITATQNHNLMGVCRNLLNEIDNTLVSSFPMIRANLINIGVSIMTQKAMLSAQSTQDLEKNTALLAAQTSADLAVKGETLASSARLREAETMKTLVEGLKDLQGRLQTAKAQSKQDIESATNILTQATTDLKQILG